MASAWAKIQPITKTISFDEITAEEMAKRIPEKEFETYENNVDKTDTLDQCGCYELDETDSDAVIAQLLQNQFNNEYDLMLKRTEEKFNGHSKVGISYVNYRISPTIGPDDRKEVVDDENADLDRFVNVEREYASIPRCGYKKNSEGSEIVTKHDMLMSSRINACRVLEFPPGISTGDTGGFDVKLNNKVFNSLRAHSYAHCSRQKSKPKTHHK
ncbi:serine/threonine-protein kinase RIO3-like [Diachasmimorpha longicaudata]|uniref:serine/threonine-protein kinase RIO3-like n=1 Tax=Diachasmimorpha longicaudata TaxID=58733 RepID=UPI0030B8C7AA